MKMEDSELKEYIKDGNTQKYKKIT